MLRAIDLFFDSNFFQSLPLDRKSISFQLYCSIKGLIFYILSGWSLICSRFNATLKAY